MKEKKMIRKLFLLLVLLPAVLLSGCGTPGRDRADGKDNQPEPALAASDPDAVIDDSWKKDGFVCRKALNLHLSSGTFRETRYIELEETAPDFPFSSVESEVAYLGDARYELIAYAVPDDARGTRYFLETRGPDEEAPRRVELSAGGELPPAGRVINMDAVTESDLAVLFLTEEDEYRIIHLDGSGKLLSRASLASCFREQQITLNELRYYWWCDEQGNSYVVSPKQRLFLSMMARAGCS